MTTLMELTAWGDYVLVVDGRKTRILNIEKRIEPDAGLPILYTNDIPEGEAWVISPNSPHVVEAKVKNI